jgi:hypothetical protein
MTGGMTDGMKAPGEVLEQGTYEIIQARLREHSESLRQRLENLNAARKAVFGSIETKLLGNSRLTTEYNCIPRGALVGAGFALRPLPPAWWCCGVSVRLLICGSCRSGRGRRVRVGIWL